MGKIARITNDGKLLIKGELIEEGVDFLTPKDISGCQLWLDATTIQANNGDNILLWEDLSGNNNHATQTNQSQQPIFIDNAVVFDGVDDSLEFGADKFNMGLDDMTVFSVITTTKTTDQSIFSKAKASRQDYRYALRMTRGGVMDGFMQGNGGGDVTPFGVTNLANGNPHVLVHEFNRSGNLSLYADGIYEGGASISHWENANMVSINPSRLGAYTASNNISPTSAFEGKIMEILIYDRVLSKEEREEVKLYLETKWLKDKEVSFKPNGDLHMSGKLTEGGQANPLIRISNIFNIAINELIENYDFTFKPLSMEGIQAYFDASVLDVGNVPIWEDLTENGNNLVTSSSTPEVIPNSLNGLNTLAFDANPMTFPSTFKIQPNASIYMIVKSNSVGGTLQTILGTQGITAVAAPRFYIAYHNGYLMRTQGRQTSSGVSIQDDFVVFGVRHNEVGDMVLQVNDAIVEANGHITQYNNETVQFGFSNYRGFKGEIGELIIFNRMLGDKEHNAIYDYLKEKWGV